MKGLPAIKTMLDYNPETGAFIWKNPPSNFIRKGEAAGKKTISGYVVIHVKGKAHYAHRLAWYFQNGIMPNCEIDHKNRNKSDNRISNLRTVSHQCNMRNSGRQKNNKSGVTGVCLCKRRGRYLSYIKVNGKSKVLGLSCNLLDAALLRLAAEQCLEWSGCNSTSDAYLFVKNHIHKEKK